MAEKKISKRDMFEGIKATLVENFEEDDIQVYVDFIDKEIDALNAKNEKEKERRAAKRAEDDGLLDAVAEAIRNAEEPVTADQILEVVSANGDFEELTRSKISYRASKLAKDEVVYKVNVKTEDGRKAVAYTSTKPVED